jgi:hypothetical protein
MCELEPGPGKSCSAIEQVPDAPRPEKGIDCRKAEIRLFRPGETAGKRDTTMSVAKVIEITEYRVDMKVTFVIYGT